MIKVEDIKSSKSFINRNGSSYLVTCRKCKVLSESRIEIEFEFVPKFNNKMSRIITVVIASTLNERNR